MDHYPFPPGPRGALAQEYALRRSFAPQRLGRVRLPSGAPGSLISMDPPDHTRMRRLLSGVSTPRQVNAWRPRLRELAAGLIDSLPAEFDFAHDFAFPLAAQIIAGHETTGSVLSRSIVRLLDPRSGYERLVARPELIAETVEELLRVEQPGDSPLLRVELQEILGVLVDRLPGLALAVPGEKLAWTEGSIIIRPVEVPVLKEAS